MTVMAIPRTTIVPTEQNKHMTAIAILHVRITIVLHAEQNQYRSLEMQHPSIHLHSNMRKSRTFYGGGGETGEGFFDNFFEYFKELLLDLRMYMIIKIKMNIITCRYALN